HKVGLSSCNPYRMYILWLCSNLDMAVDRATFLREARHVNGAAALAFEMRGHAQNGAYRDDACATNAGDQNAIRLGANRRKGGAGKLRKIVGSLNLRLPRAGAMHRY